MRNANRCARLAGLTALSLLALAPAAMAADFTWSGTAPAGSPEWTQTANWVGGAAPPTSGAPGNVIFPALLGCSVGFDTCGTSSDDLGADVTAASLSIDDGFPYTLDGSGHGTR